MNTFEDIKRLTKWKFQTEGVQLGVFALSVLFVLMSIMFNIDTHNRLIAQLIGAAAAFSFPIITLWTAVFAARMGQYFRTKEKTINYLTLPGEIKNKFWVNFVFNVVLPPFLLLVIFFVLSGINIWMHYDLYDVPQKFGEAITYLENENLIFELIVVVVFFFLSVLIPHLCFMLGGIVFKKHAVVKVLLIMFGWVVVYSILTINLGDFMPGPVFFGKYIDHSFKGHGMEAVLYAYTAFYALVSTLLIYVSYRLFVRKTVA